MCAFFSTLIIWILTSDFRARFEHKISCSSLPLPSFISFFLQDLIHGLLWWWASSRLIFSLKWRLLSLFLPPFCCHSSSKKQRNPLMKKILGLQAPMELESISQNIFSCIQSIINQMSFPFFKNSNLLMKRGILECFDMADSKPSSTPYPQHQVSSYIMEHQPSMQPNIIKLLRLYNT